MTETPQKPDQKAARVIGKPTLKTISKLSGLAIPTVSRALSDAPDISEKTKEKIREIAAEIGYVPNRAGVRLRTGKTLVISLILAPDSELMPHTAQLITSIAQTLRETPYHLNVTPYLPDDDPMKPIRQIVENRLADAVILNRTQADDPRVAYLLDKKFPFATHGRTNMSERHAYFDYDNTAFGDFAVRHLAEKGRKSIVLLAPMRNQVYATHMIQGTLDAATDIGSTLTVLDGVNSDEKIEDIRKAIALHLRLNPECDGLICGSGVAAMAAAVGAADAGRNIGVDFDIFSKEATSILRFCHPNILTIREDVSEAGKFLANAVVSALSDPDAAPKQGLQVPSEADLNFA